VRKPLTDFQFVLLLGAMSMIGPFAIDTLFPAFPIAGPALGVSQALMQQTISSYLFAFAIGSLLHGPLSDSFGRRPIVLICMVGFVLGSIGCWLATSFSSLLAFRAVQGFSAAGGTVISRALVRDRFDGARAQQATSQITLVFLLGPAIAPLLGGLILRFAGSNHWRLIFAFITLYSVGVAFALWRKLGESHPPENRLTFSAPALLKSYLTIFRSQAAVWLILAAAFNFSGLFLMISSAPAIVFGLWKLGTLDLWKLFVFAMGGILLGSQLSGYVAARWPHARTIGLGFLVMICACIAHISYGAWVAHPAWPIAAIPILIYAAGSSLAYPSLTVLLMDRFPERRGAAASLQTFVSLAFNGFVAGTISPFAAVSTLKLSATQGTIMLAGLASYGLFVLSQKHAQRLVDASLEIG
jgi:MFS transporter, DHA1 family, multidrug resistance protein